MKDANHKRTNTRLPSYEVPRVIRFFKAESRTAAATRWREGNVKLVFTGYRVTVLLDEKVTEMDGDNDRTTSIYLTLLNANLND